MDLKELGKNLEKRIHAFDEENQKAGRLISPKTVEIRILGQMALFFNEEFSQRVSLEATLDLDALINANHEIENLVVEEIELMGLVLDELSKEIWMPEGTWWETAFKGEYVTIRIPDPISIIVSKAKFAKEKNKKLINETLREFGKELEERLKSEGVDFEKDES